MGKLVGVGDVITNLRFFFFAFIAETKFFFAITPPSGHFREKRRSVWSFAMVDLGGVGEVSERFEHFFFNMGFNGVTSQGRGFRWKGGTSGKLDRCVQFSKTFNLRYGTPILDFFCGYRIPRALTALRAVIAKTPIT